MTAPSTTGFSRNTIATEAATVAGELLHCTRYGPLRVPGGDDLISRFLARYGEWAFIETDFVLGQVRRGAHVFDIGAFVGTFALGMLRGAPSRVLAVEGNPAVHPMLVENLQRNCLLPFEAPLLVVGRPGVTAAQPSNPTPANLGASSFVAAGGDAQPGGTVVEVVGLGELRRRHGDPDLIKLDIEGGELQALQTDADWLRQRLPVLWVECNESPRSLPLCDFIAGLGYELHYFAFPSHNPDNHLRDAEPMFPVAYEAGLLAVPPGQPVVLSAWQRMRGCDLIPVRDREHLRECLWVTPRWGSPHWVNIPTSRLQAICSHLQNQDSFDDFLKQP